MKFVKTTYRKLKSNDYIKFVANNAPTVSVYGYIRIHSGEKWLQSKNMIQKINKTFLHIKPKTLRYFKIRLKQNDSFFILK